jgi:hypothetical protein
LQVIHAEAVAFAYEGIREAFVREASGHSEAASKVFPGYNETLESQNIVPVVHQLYSSGVRSGHIAHAHACTCFKYRKKKLKWSCKHGKTCREGRNSDENVADDELDDATVLIGDIDDALGQDASAVDDQDREDKPSPRTMGQILPGPYGDLALRHYADDVMPRGVMPTLAELGRDVRSTTEFTVAYYSALEKKQKTFEYTFNGTTIKWPVNTTRRCGMTVATLLAALQLIHGDKTSYEHAFMVYVVHMASLSLHQMGKWLCGLQQTSAMLLKATVLGTPREAQIRCRGWPSGPRVHRREAGQALLSHRQ